MSLTKETRVEKALEHSRLFPPWAATPSPTAAAASRRQLPVAQEASEQLSLQAALRTAPPRLLLLLSRACRFFLLTGRAWEFFFRQRVFPVRMNASMSSTFWEEVKMFVIYLTAFSL